jgi:hypothetical protein
MRILYILSIGMALSACGQADYSTWNCYTDGQSDQKVVMILQESTMKIGDQKLSYCGSLGLVSYFDRSCKVETKNSMAQLIPSQSLLTIDTKQYRCEKL